jgi:hypothetical protein
MVKYLSFHNSYFAFGFFLEDFLKIIFLHGEIFEFPQIYFAFGFFLEDFFEDHIFV